MLIMLSNMAATIFAIIAVSYLAQLSALVRDIKRDKALWARIGEPSLMTISGQRQFDRLIFHPAEIPITNQKLLKKILVTKLLMFSGLASFVVAVALFFLSGKAGALAS